MSFAKDALQSELEYSSWADSLILEACSALTPQELIRDMGVSHRDIISTLFHFYDGERFWFKCLKTHTIPPLDMLGGTEQPNKPPEQILENLHESWPQQWQQLLQWFATTTAADLTVEIGSKLSSGITLSFFRWQILRHMSTHATLHRGQIVGMLRMLGKQPPSTDLLTFYVLSLLRESVD